MLRSEPYLGNDSGLLDFAAGWEAQAKNARRAELDDQIVRVVDRAKVLPLHRNARDRGDGLADDALGERACRRVSVKQGCVNGARWQGGVEGGWVEGAGGEVGGRVACDCSAGAGVGVALVGDEPEVRGASVCSGVLLFRCSGWSCVAGNGDRRTDVESSHGSVDFNGNCV